MRRNIDGTCGSSCRNPNIRTINTMDADTTGNFEIRAGNSVSITTETNGIRIAYTGGITTYDNTDGNLVIDNANFTIDLANDISITGDMIIAGDLTVNGTYYTVHAEHVYTEDDYIIMRDGAVTGLGSGDFSGFQVKLYDGVNDGRLVIDNSGTARVGDVGDEQPLLTRDESADLTDGNLLKWDGVNQKAIDGGKPITTSLTTFGSVSVPYNTLTDLASLTTPTNGTYLIQAHTDAHVIGTGSERNSLALDIAGSTVWMRSQQMLSGTYQREGFTYITTLNQGDIIKLQVQHTLNASVPYYGEFALIRLY